MPLSKIQFGNIGRRRLNPNGAMLVSQRATTKATLTNGYNCLDRVFTYKSHDGVVEESQSTDTPNNEFYNSLKHRVTTADTSIASGQYHALSFRLEGNSVTQLGFGTSGAKKVTVSFWVKSSVAGAYGTCLRNYDATRFNMRTMTINSADTWEKKSITYTGDTGGTWPKDNTEGFQFQISMSMGTDFQGTSADTWVSTVDVAPSNVVNWLATVGNTFYLTGLQIEEGDTATDFEHRSFQEELDLCHRYFFSALSDTSGGNYSVFPVNFRHHVSTGNNGHTAFQVALPKKMRATPSLSHNISNSNHAGSGQTASATNWNFYHQNQGWSSYAGNGNANTFSRSAAGNAGCQVGTYYLSPAAVSADQIAIGNSLQMHFSAEL